MSQFTVQAGRAVTISTGADITTAACTLIGFYVDSTSSGVLTLGNAGAGTSLTGLITPAVGYHAYPMLCPDGLFATIGNTMNLTLFVVEGMS